LIVVVSGQRDVEDKKFVPSERIIFPAVAEAFGYVGTDHDGAPEAPDISTLFAVAVPARIASAEPVE
jgi:hypothetical protein